MPQVAGSVKELLAALDGIVRIEGERLVVVDEAALRTRGIYDLAWTATFTEDEPTRQAAQWMVWEASQETGARSASIHDMYVARGRGEYEGLTVPAINLRAQTFDMARIILETAQKNDASAVIFELARSEQTYTYQRVFEYATSVLAGAVAAGWKGPVFIQGDHYQFNAKKYAADPEKMTEEIRKGCRDAIAAGYRNIDIDSSTLVDLSHDTLDAQQRENYVRAAELTALIRTLEADGVTVSVGGEIGEVGKSNSNPAELKAYLEGYRKELDARAPGAIGLSKVSVQTGTSHGGTPLADGGVAAVALDFNVLTELSKTAREYGLSGAVQHGASTLPDDMFHKFPATGCSEIHLATGFQNALYEHPAFPADRGVGLRQLRRRAQGGPDRRPVRLHQPQEGDRAVQAPAVGSAHQGRDPGGSGRQDRLPVQAARRAGQPGPGRQVRQARRVPQAAAGGPQGSLGSVFARRNEGRPRGRPFPVSGRRGG
jgi:fructose/tagatose bisphosphate aldolase